MVPEHFAKALLERHANCTKGVNCGVRGVYSCGRCRRLRKRMCREYHKVGMEVERAYNDDTVSASVVSRLAAEELEMRLEYEYVFGIITEKDVERQWSPGRDFGHNTRISKLHRLMQW